MISITETWKRDKLKSALWLCWLATVFFSFWYQTILSFPVPLIGTMSPFRVFLPITAILYLVWAIREKEWFWKSCSALEKWCYLLIALLLIYGAISLCRAMDFIHTFRRLFNLALDLCFFFLMLRLCRDKQLLRLTLGVTAVVLVIHVSIGFYESFRGGVFSDVYNNYRGGYIFKGYTRTAHVTYGNPNDFVSNLLMCSSILLLAVCRKWEKISGKGFYAAAIWLPVIYASIRLAQSRLVTMAFYALLVGFLGFLLFADRKRMRPMSLSLVMIACVLFVNEYHAIAPKVEKLWVETQIVWFENVASSDSLTPPGLSDETAEALEQLQASKERIDASDVSRVQLLKHAVGCFWESYGLGIGLGNTEKLLTANQPDGLGAIHCFLARIVADYGIFALAPLCIIAFLLLKQVWQIFRIGLQIGNRHMVGWAWLSLCVLVTYPFTSTAPSDAQDLLGMWIYLAAVVLLICEPWANPVCENAELQAETW